MPHIWMWDVRMWIFEVGTCWCFYKEAFGDGRSVGDIHDGAHLYV